MATDSKGPQAPTPSPEPADLSARKPAWLVAPDLPFEIAAAVMALPWASAGLPDDEPTDWLCDRHGDVQTAASAVLARSAPGADPDRALKDALFACIHAGAEDRQYGGVLVEGGRYASISFTTTLAASPTAPAGEPVAWMYEYQDVDRRWRPVVRLDKPEARPGRRNFQPLGVISAASPQGGDDLPVDLIARITIDVRRDGSDGTRFQFAQGVNWHDAEIAIARAQCALQAEYENRLKCPASPSKTPTAPAQSGDGWKDDLEQMVAREWPEGRSAGAAARELCRTLGVAGVAPTLQRLLTDLLGQANFAAHDRTLILSDFAEASPEAARIAKLESFERWNPHITEAPETQGGER